MKDFFKNRLSLTIMLVLFVFGVIVGTFLVIAGILATLTLLNNTGIISLPDQFSQNTDGNNENPFSGLIAVFILCIFIGTALTALLSKLALNPIRKVIAAIHEVANGDFHVKVEAKGIIELKELSQSFNKMTHELSSIETLRSDFINNFSHEFKTPIVSLRGYAKLLKKGNISEYKKMEYLDIIIGESERLASLSTNVLTLSKYENLEIIIDKAPFRLDEQIRKAILSMESKWSAKDISMDVELDKVIYYGNEDLTQQIWLNLLENAIKFSYEGGLISITLKSEKDEIRFDIVDEGIGMDEDILVRIFDRFYQGNPSHSVTGNGLGLALVKRIVKLCDGEIHVESELGEGSAFSIVLPLKSDF